MQTAPQLYPSHVFAEGIRLTDGNPAACRTFFQVLGVAAHLECRSGPGGVDCSMSPAWLAAFAPEGDTLSLHTYTAELKQEILWSMLASPHRFEFQDLAALGSAIRVRENIALAARKTALAFKTEAAERPSQFWRYEEEAGFILEPGAGLIDALISATQPEATGKLYDFSCYRASEYVVLLGLAQEAAAYHPGLLQQLQALNEVHAVRSGQFHDVYLHEYGSLNEPLPTHFFVPGDRLWFRNPDEASADVTGYEGSWVIYMGGGLFSNFWKRDKSFTLVEKCVEIYHWRHGLTAKDQGEPWMDEAVVEARVAATFSNPAELEQVLSRMMRMRDPQGVYAEGGCLDASRECPKQIHLGACELVLPAVSAL